MTEKFNIDPGKCYRGKSPLARKRFVKRIKYGDVFYCDPHKGIEGRCSRAAFVRWMASPEANR